MKTCTKCEIEWLVGMFPKMNKSKDGLSSWCKECHKKYREDNKTRRKKINDTYQSTEEFKIKRRKYKKKWYLGRGKEYYIENYIKCPRRIKAPEEKLETKLRREKRTRHSRTAYQAVRRAKKLNATMDYSTNDKISLLYDKCKWLESLTGLKYHVDHVIPLNGKNVSGLHVWENLQILEASINFSKGNK